MIQIFTDTSANLPAAYIQKYSLRVIPLTYFVDGAEAHQDPAVDFDGKAYYDAMRSGTPVSTAMINLAAFLEPLHAALAAGDDVIYIGMSGGISGTAHAAAMAVQELQEEFPERKIAAIDTYAASLGEGLLVIEAARMLENGAPFSLIVEQISRRRHTMCQYFTVDDLAYLERGGRVSKAAAIVGTVLKIKPLLRGDDEGKIVQCGKTRGRKQSLTALADFYEKLVADKSEEIGIAHADDAAGAQFLLDALPIGARRLLGLVVTVFIIVLSLQLIGQVLLLHPMTRVAVRILVALLTLEARAVGMDVLQLTRDGPRLPCPNVGDRGVDGHDNGVGLRRRGQQQHCLRQRQPRLRQAELKRAVHAGFHDHGRLRIGKADILARRAQDAPARTDQVAGLEQARQIMQRRVGIRAAQRLHERGHDVIVVVARTVIVHGAALRDVLGIRAQEADGIPLSRRRRKEQLDRIERLAHIAAADGRDIPRRARLDVCRDVFPCAENGHRAQHGLFHLGGRHLLELKHRAAAEHRVIDIEIRVFRCRGNDRDAAVLHELQQRLLLLFVEVLDLVEIQQHTAGREHGIELGNDIADVRNARGRGVQAAQGAVRAGRDDACDRGLAGAGRAVKHHVRDLAGLHDAAEHPVRAQNMLLPDDIVERGRPDFIRQWSVHSAPPVMQWRYYTAFCAPWQLAALGRRRKMCYTAGEVNNMRTPEQVQEILRCLAQAYPADCSLQYQKDYELLFAVRLAAQCTDERVNQVTPALYARFPTLEAFAAAEPEDVEPYVHSCGFYRAKARDIVLCARKLVAEYGGRVPDTMEALTSLPGVGRKTANLILGDVYHKPAVVVDTHCIRLSNRMGLVDGLKDPVKIETALRKILPPEESSDFCHRLVLHGRAVCTARKPLCSTCCVRHVCQTAEEMEL